MPTPTDPIADQTADPSAEFSEALRNDRRTRLADVGTHRDALTKMRELQSERLKLRLAQEQRVLVSADDVNRVLADLGLDMVSQCQAVEQNMSSFLDAHGRKHLRGHLTKAIDYMRERLAGCLIRQASDMDAASDLPAFEAERLQQLTISKATPKTTQKRKRGRPRKNEAIG